MYEQNSVTKVRLSIHKILDLMFISVMTEITKFKQVNFVKVGGT